MSLRSSWLIAVQIYHLFADFLSICSINYWDILKCLAVTWDLSVLMAHTLSVSISCFLFPWESCSVLPTHLQNEVLLYRAHSTFPGGVFTAVCLLFFFFFPVLSLGHYVLDRSDWVLLHSHMKDSRNILWCKKGIWGSVHVHVALLKLGTRIH